MVGHVGTSASALRRFLIFLAVIAVALPSITVSASASSEQPITITTSKPFGPVAEPSRSVEPSLTVARWRTDRAP